MDDKLKQILRLYGELGPGSTVPDEPALREEFEAVRQVKDALDRRARERVPEAAVQRVLQAAADRDPERRRRDRRPASRHASPGRPLFAAAGSTVILLMMGVMLFINLRMDAPVEVPSAETAIADVRPERPAEVAPATSEPEVEQATPSPSESVQERQPVRQSAGTVDRTPVQRSTTPARDARVVLASDEGALSGLAWDDAQDVRNLHQMIDVVQRRGEEFDWDEPAVPLELLPDARRRTGGPNFYQVNQSLPPR